MPNDFQQTVNLRKKFEHEKIERARLAQKPSLSVDNKMEFRNGGAKAEAIDKVYRDDNMAKPDLKKIIRPQFKQWDKELIKRIGLIVVAVIFFVVVVGLVARSIGKANDKSNTLAGAGSWYAVSLVTGEIYYGQIADIKANPVVIDNVYYDYDQQNKKTETASGTGNIRLVKKGKESYGPSGKMMVYQAQIKSVDELSNDSKVRQAILDYESKK